MLPQDPNGPISLWVDDRRIGRVVVDVTPAILAAPDMPGMESAVWAIRNNRSQWPKDPQKREDLCQRIVLIPVNDLPKFTITPMLMHKYLLKLMDDGDATNRLKLFRCFKLLNRKIWNKEGDEESIKLGLNCLINTMFEEVNTYQFPSDWDNENILNRYISILKSIRTKLGNAAYYPKLWKVLEEYGVPNTENVNVMGRYRTKNGAYLNPKLSHTVRQLDFMLRKPLDALEDIAFQLNNGR